MPTDFRLSIENARKWLALAERRRAYFVELQRTGRWHRYYSETTLQAHLRDSAKDVENWALLLERWSGEGEPQPAVRIEAPRRADAPVSAAPLIGRPERRPAA